MTRTRPQARRAFTLLEMTISIGLMIVLMSMTYQFYWSSLQQRTEGLQSAQRLQLARVILDQMARELRQAVAFAPRYGPGVFGYTDRIEINSACLPDKQLQNPRDLRDEPLPGQLDLQNIKYYIAWDEVNVDSNGDPRPLGLVRRVNRTYFRDVIVQETGLSEEQTQPDEVQAFKEELYAPELKYLEFRYFDGAKWWKTWELAEGNSLPQIVQIIIGYIPVLPEELDEMDMVDEDFLNDAERWEPLPPDRYTIFVRFPQADLFFGSRLTREASMFSAAEEGAGL